MPNPDDPFGDDEDHEKLAALAKSFEEKYVSYFTRLQMDKLMYIYKATDWHFLKFKKKKFISYIIHFERVTCKESC